jgi:hypothetical protein
MTMVAWVDGVSHSSSQIGADLKAFDSAATAGPSALQAVCGTFGPHLAAARATVKTSNTIPRLIAKDWSKYLRALAPLASSCAGGANGGFGATLHSVEAAVGTDLGALSTDLEDQGYNPPR